MQLLGLEEAECDRLGVKTYKIGMVWPLDVDSFEEWAEGLDLIIVVEEKRKILEPQIKEVLFNKVKRCRVLGHKDAEGKVLFPTQYAIEPIMIAQNLGKILGNRK